MRFRNDGRMLELIRKYRTIFMTIFILSSAGMVISMFGSSRMDRMSGGAGLMGGGVAAKVSGEEVSTQELMQNLQRKMQQMEQMIDQQSAGAGNNPETRKFLEQMMRSQVSPDSVLNQLIQRKFMVVTARDLGIHASNDSIRSLIQSNPAFQKDGHFDPLAYRQMVTDPGLYEQDVASQINITALSKVFQAALSVTSPQEKQEREFLKKKVRLATLVVNPSTFPEPKAVSDAEVAEFQKNPAADTQIKAYYDQNIRKYESPEEIHARHILIDEKSGGEAKAKEILQEVTDKKITFEAAAKKYSTDTSNKDKGGDLGFFGKGAMVPEFEQAAWAMHTAGELSKLPVKTKFGYHIIEYVDRKAATKRDLKDVKAEIARDVLLTQRKAEKAKEWTQAAVAGGKVPSDSETSRLGLKWNEIVWSPMDQGVGPINNLQEQRASILALTSEKPLLSQSIPQNENMVLVKYVGQEIAKKPAPVKEVAGKNSPPPAPEQPEESVETQRMQTAYEFFLRSRFEDLEKKKRIVKSEKVLADLRKRWASQSGAPGGESDPEAN